MTKQPVDYFSYLLRLWRSGKQSAWKVSLEDPQTGERRGFKNLEAVFSFLRCQIASVSDQDAKDDRESKG